jgi:transcriptional regulator with XRE-family HTH domain
MTLRVPLQQRLKAQRELPDPATRRALRLAAGLSMESVAAELGVTRQAVMTWERGTRYPRPQYLVAYVTLLRRLGEAA